MLRIRLVDDQATLNNFHKVENKEYTVFEPLTVKFMLEDSQTKNRLIPGAAGTCTVTFQKRDGGELEKDAELLVGQDDRSLWKVALTQLETEDIVGSNFRVQVDMDGDTEDVRTGMAYNVLSKITFDGEC